LAEILVFSEQDAGLLDSLLDDFGVVSLWRYLGDGDNIEAGGAKRPHDREIAALVRQEAHRLSVSWRWTR
jgi:hypothetical protein